MITPSFGLTATERVLPKLALDFTTASLDSRITFARTTGASNPATYVNSSGVIAAATNNQPRFDHDPVTLACKGLLVEEARTNSILSSDDITNATYWNQSNCVPVADQTTSPDGTTNADFLREDSANSRHDNYNATTLTAASWTYSQYLKAGGRTWAKLRLDIAGSFKGAYFDLANGVVGTVDSGYTASISNAGDGWYRCSVTTTATAVTWFPGVRLAIANGVDSYQGDNTSGVYLWGAQLEAGAFPTSYIPTEASALTRNPDVATMTGTNFSDWWQATRGGASVLATPFTVSGIRPLVQFDDNTANNIIALRGNAADPELQIVDGGASQVQLDAGTIVANTSYSLTGWWQTNDCKARQNSGATVSDYTATIPTVTQARLGSDGTNYLNGHLATINYYDRFTGQIYDRRKNKAVFSLL
jgi:hypothetical protein